MSPPASQSAFPLHPGIEPAHPSFALSRGMTLRDWFAGQALAGLLAGNSPIDVPDRKLHQAMAMGSYSLADAMLAERERGQ